MARAACVARGGPPPRAHQRKSARNIASMTAANCTPRFRSNSCQTLAEAAAIRKPAMMARSVMGSFVQRLGVRPRVVIEVTFEEPHRILHFPAAYFSLLFINARRTQRFWMSGPLYGSWFQTSFWETGPPLSASVYRDQETDRSSRQPDVAKHCGVRD